MRADQETVKLRRQTLQQSYFDAALPHFSAPPAWGALAGAFLAPFLFGLYSKKVTKASCFACFIYGAGLMVANMLFRGAFPAILQSPINSGVIAMLGGLILVPVVSLFTKKPDADKVDEMFECYQKDVLVKSKESLGE